MPPRKPSPEDRAVLPLHPSGEPPSRASGLSDSSVRQAEAADATAAAFDVLLDAQSRMRGIVECAAALNRLMAEASGKNDLPIPFLSLPPGFSAPFNSNDRSGRLHEREPEGRARRGRSSAIPAQGQERLEALVSSRGFITNEDVREAFGLTPLQATLRLKDLVGERALVRRGQRRGARYVAGPRWPPGR